MPPTSTLPVPYKIECAFNEFWNWGYSRNKPQIPQMLPGVPEELGSMVAPKGKPGVTNCTVMGGWVILAALPAAREVKGLWLDIQVGRGRDKPWSGTDSLVTNGLGVRDDAFSEVGVYAVQKWSKLDGFGHVVATPERTSEGHFFLVTVVDASSLQVREASQRQMRVVYRIVDRAAAKTWGEYRAVRLF